jgi:hypothetical protein
MPKKLTISRRKDAPADVLRQSLQLEALLARHPEKAASSATLERGMRDAGMAPPSQVTMRRVLHAEGKKPSARSTLEGIALYLGETYDEAFPPIEPTISVSLPGRRVILKAADDATTTSDLELWADIMKYGAELAKLTPSMGADSQRRAIEKAFSVPAGARSKVPRTGAKQPRR